MLRRTILRFACAAAMLMSGVAVGADPTFTSVAGASFRSWDMNGDGVLSAREIDSLVVDPTRTGEEAAALAAVKLIVRAGKIELPPLTLEFLTAAPTPPARSGEGGPVDGKPGAKSGASTDTDAQDRDAAPGIKLAPAATAPAALQARFARALKKINTAKRDLFLDPTPDLDKCRQGPLGDCFFVAGVGAAVDRDHESIKRMITAAEDGSYRVAFGNGKTVTVTALTDAEFGLTSTTGDEGLWLPVLEKAYGSLRNDAKPVEQQMEESTDAIAKGGSVGTTITALTGHAAARTNLRARVEKAEAAGEPVDPIAAEVRAKLVGAFKDRRLVGVGTDSKESAKKLPPGVSPSHAFAVLGFDAASDMVHVWNPHGNNFKPKGGPGMDHGYLTKAGRFDIPLGDFVRVFRGMSIETDEAPKARPVEKTGAAKPGASTRP